MIRRQFITLIRGAAAWPVTAAGAVPHTSLALVTELFRDWTSPLADKAREVIKWYQPEVQKLLSARQQTCCVD